LTTRGAVPFRPGFGLGAEQLLGGNMKSIDLAYEVTDQLSQYEKRIRVKQVLSREIAPGHVEVEIRYEIVATGETESVVIRN
jgi:phage baseplate assembly protein W